MVILFIVKSVNTLIWKWQSQLAFSKSGEIETKVLGSVSTQQYYQGRWWNGYPNDNVVGWSHPLKHKEYVLDKYEKAMDALDKQ